MPTFNLLPLEVPARAVKSIYVLEVDGASPFADFAGKMKKAGKKSDLSKIEVLLEELALGRTLPNNACKPLRGVPKDDNWQEFELRKNQLRVYFFLIPPDDNVIVVGEFKKGNKQQIQTIAEFRRLKAAFKIFYQSKEEE
ncbi:MAG: hypothetical protein AAGA31_00050 [Bacteroidota bacterium]